MVVGTKDGIVMVESGAKEIPEEVVVGAIEFAHEEIKKIVAGIEHLVSLAGKTKRTVTPLENDEVYAAALKAKVGDRLKAQGQGRRSPQGRSRHPEASQVRQLRAGQGHQGRAQEGASRRRSRGIQEALEVL